MPDPGQLVVTLYDPIRAAEVVGHEEIFPLLVGGKPAASLDSDRRVQFADGVIHGLQFAPLPDPYVVDLPVRKLILAQQGDDPYEELAFVRIVNVVLFVVGVGVFVYRQRDVADFGHGPDLAGRFVVEHFSCVADYGLPSVIVPLLAHLREDPGVFGLPDLAEGKRGPKHFSVVQCRHSVFEVIGWLRDIPF